MALAVGTRLGPYEITAAIGAGGMGEVYRATDTNLKRPVAIKVLPDSVATDRERLARFHREAEVLAALNHPNIAHIHGLEKSGGQVALVMELVEGPTLADRIGQGPIPLSEALPIAKQIAEALEAAHEQGIIHRDLKPANIKVKHDGTVKVLDFGLAKAMDSAAAASGISAATLSMSPTITTPAMTQMGMILGTAAYMSPEQARGKPVDRRADIWAFGCVLFEMLTGARAFEGEDIADTLGNVMKVEPNWERVPASVPARVERVLRACLQKKARERLDSAQDVRLALDGAFETVVRSAGESVAPLPAPRWRRALPFAATALAMTGLLLAVGWAVWPSPPAAPVTRSTHLLPEGVSFRGAGRSVLAIAPDASRFVYSSDDGLRVRERGSLTDHVIPGTEQRVANPFFSPDGLSVGFLEGDQLRKIAVSGGASTPLTPRITNLFGASWETDGTILYGQPDGIWRVSANGGEPEHVIVTEPGEQADGPQLLPGGEWVLFAVTRASGQTRWDEAEIVAESLVTRERRPIRQGGSAPRYLPTGHLLYALQDVLYAVPFDPARLEETGRPSPVVEGVMRAAGAALNTGAAMAAVAADGTLVYVPGTTGTGVSQVLVHVSERGEAQPLGVPADGYQALRVSPNGMFVATEVDRGEGTAIWVADLTRATLSPVTSVDVVGDFAPVWSPDGSQVIYASEREGVWGFYRRSADGTGAEELLAEVEGADRLAPGNWSPDGRSLVFMMRRTNETNRDVAVLSLDGDPTWRPLVHSEADEAHPVISPNGQWLAYSSDDGGSQEVYLQRFPDLGDRRKVSTNGGMDPAWAPDGRKLYYLDAPGNGPPVAMAAVTVDPRPPLSIGTPDVLFPHSPYRRPPQTPRWYDVMPAGDGFVMVAADTAGDDAPAPQVITVQSWFQELQRLVPRN